MRGFNSLCDYGLIHYAMKGLCEVIARSPHCDLDLLNEQFAELNQRRLDIRADIMDAPFDCGVDYLR